MTASTASYWFHKILGENIWLKNHEKRRVRGWGVGGGFWCVMHWNCTIHDEWIIASLTKWNGRFCFPYILHFSRTQRVQSEEFMDYITKSTGPSIKFSPATIAQMNFLVGATDIDEERTRVLMIVTSFRIFENKCFWRYAGTLSPRCPSKIAKSPSSWCLTLMNLATW